MQAYLARRIILGGLTALLVSLLIFAILRIAPGDVAMMIAMEITGGEASDITEEDLQAIRESVGLNAPLPQQYVNWLIDILRLDWEHQCSLARKSGMNSRVGYQSPCNW